MARPDQTRQNTRKEHILEASRSSRRNSRTSAKTKTNCTRTRNGFPCYAHQLGPNNNVASCGPPGYSWHGLQCGVASQLARINRHAPALQHKATQMAKANANQVENKSHLPRGDTLGENGRWVIRRQREISNEKRKLMEY